MAGATPDLRLLSQPQSVTAPWPVPNYAWFPPFRCRSSVAVSPFCRCKIPLFCKNYVRKFRSVTAINGKKICNGSGNGNGNGNGIRKRQRLMGTEWWKPGIILLGDRRTWV